MVHQYGKILLLASTVLTRLLALSLQRHRVKIFSGTILITSEVARDQRCVARSATNGAL
jgi:hypothetical protein